MNYMFGFNRERTFNTVYLYSHKSYPMDSPIQLVCNGEVIYDGNYVTGTPKITLDHSYTDTNLTVVVLNNTKD